jgi:hypothetical protein
MARRAAKPRPPQRPPAGDQPQAVRRAARTGPTALAPNDWPDPDDAATPRAARRVHGFRAFDPIAAMAADRRSGLDAKHIHAANKLRELADAVMYGYSGDWLPVFAAMIAAPRAGPSPGEIARVRAARRLSRLWARFTPDQQWLLIFVVLENRKVAEWVRFRQRATGRRVDPQGERRLLVGLLDQVWQYFESEISREIDLGRRQQI